MSWICHENLGWLSQWSVCFSMCCLSLIQDQDCYFVFSWWEKNPDARRTVYLNPPASWGPWSFASFPLHTPTFPPRTSFMTFFPLCSQLLCISNSLFLCPFHLAPLLNVKCMWCSPLSHAFLPASTSSVFWEVQGNLTSVLSSLTIILPSFQKLR